MKAENLNEGTLDNIKKKAGKLKKAASDVLPNTKKATTPSTDPSRWDDEDGNLRQFVKVNYNGVDYEWSGRYWKNIRTGKIQPTNTAAHAEMMKQVGRAPNGTKLPEYPNIFSKALAWWNGKHGEFGAASRKHADPLVKTIGLAGAAIDSAIRHFPKKNPKTRMTPR